MGPTCQRSSPRPTSARARAHAAAVLALAPPSSLCAGNLASRRRPPSRTRWRPPSRTLGEFVPRRPPLPRAAVLVGCGVALLARRSAAGPIWTSATGEAQGSASTATTAATVPRPDDLVLDLTQRLHALVLRLISVRAGGAGTAAARARGCGPRGRQPRCQLLRPRPHPGDRGPPSLPPPPTARRRSSWPASGRAGGSAAPVPEPPRPALGAAGLEAASLAVSSSGLVPHPGGRGPPPLPPPPAARRRSSWPASGRGGGRRSRCAGAGAVPPSTPGPGASGPRMGGDGRRQRRPGQARRRRKGPSVRTRGEGK